MIYKGPGLMLVFHLTLLYGATLLLFQSFQNQSCRYLTLALPWIPQVFSYSWTIWKDVGFTFSFLFVGAALGYVSAKKKNFSALLFFSLTLVLLYGTAIKFQAQYCAPVFLLWMSSLFLHQKNKIHIFVLFGMVSAIFYTSLYLTNKALVPSTHQSHSWQLVKLYDLSAISTHSNQSFLPEFTKTPVFSMEELKKRFNHRSVDDLVFTNPIIKIGKTDKERNDLWYFWARTCLHHPFLYFMHRSENLGYALLSMPGGDVADSLLNTYLYPGSTSFFITNGIIRIIGSFILAHAFAVLFSFFYIILGVYSWKCTWASVPLLAFNTTGLLMIIILFFCSMAGTPRYTYVTVCLFHASHAFAYVCWQALRNRIYIE